jgi:hypothetical protein
MFGVYNQVSTWGTPAALPVALWELSLGKVWLVVNGFKPDVPPPRQHGRGHKGPGRCSHRPPRAVRANLSSGPCLTTR